ncbi:UDP-N-acetylglucosamine 2-epimerase [uncultured Desulfatiglans sp.]|uniref:UDP-N-acetylglucosamine 2-epimerase n=1 Tax=Uncultured Desulfatiglans sp. TaxID=1748965 RepID=A0A653A6I1_UNCDX|nr:UDP-N-acetylglucosamine 2-epimerase [uncultured Desulfatiglans sp.]
MNICIVVGTRPEIIKMSPIMRLCQIKRRSFYVVHTGQHYSFSLDKVFFEELQLPKPEYNLEVGSHSHSKQTGRILERIENVFSVNHPDIVLVQGDTNSVLAGALAGAKAKIKVGHVEAGLRSFDRNMPEEINRVVADHICDYLYAPTEIAKTNLINEGITENQIFVTGNTVTDAILGNLNIAQKESDIMRKLGVGPDSYFLATFHRPENVDNRTKLENIIIGLEQIASDNRLPVVVPLHPRTQKMIKTFEIGHLSDSIKFIGPVTYLDFVSLLNNAKLVFTDSGGVQEEACILKVPCITLRENTERPETIDIGANLLAGTDLNRIVECSRIMLNKPTDWANPYGDGQAAAIIMAHLDEELG